MESSKIQLNSSAISSVPFQNYDKDFVFVVNGDEFKTNKNVSDLLSKKICQIHTIDPTFDRFTINTTQKGDFSTILNLINFQQNSLSEEDLPFVLEVIENLGNDSIKYIKPQQKRELTDNNVFEELLKHEKYRNFFESEYEEEIEFVSSNFIDHIDTKEEILEKLDIYTIIRIISSQNLRISDEDQLLRFINKLYSKDSRYFVLYEYVYFFNVSTESIKEFIDIYDIDYITKDTWLKICQRLIQKVQTNEQLSKMIKPERYKKKFEEFGYSEDKVFSGILNYLKTSSNNIENEINITASSCADTNSYPPKNVLNYDDKTKLFHSSCIADSWLCIDFKERRVMPSHYTIRSEHRYGTNNYHLKNWVIEGSNDNKSWEVLDERKNCSYLNGQSYVHTFEIQQHKSENYEFIRIRQNGPNWHNDNWLIFDSIEIYGKLIQK